MDGMRVHAYDGVTRNKHLVDLESLGRGQAGKAGGHGWFEAECLVDHVVQIFYDLRFDVCPICFTTGEFCVERRLELVVDGWIFGEVVKTTLMLVYRHTYYAQVAYCEDIRVGQGCTGGVTAGYYKYSCVFLEGPLARRC